MRLPGNSEQGRLLRSIRAGRKERLEPQARKVKFGSEGERANCSSREQPILAQELALGLGLLPLRRVHMLLKVLCSGVALGCSGLNLYRTQLKLA